MYNLIVLGNKGNLSLYSETLENAWTMLREIHEEYFPEDSYSGEFLAKDYDDNLGRTYILEAAERMIDSNEAHCRLGEIWDMFNVGYTYHEGYRFNPERTLKK